MTEGVVPLHGEHQEAQALMPWYATGALDDIDRAKVEAHLAACADCRAALAGERRLRAALADLPFEADQGWSRLAARLDAEASRSHGLGARLGEGVGAAIGALRAAPAWLGWALAAQTALVSAALVAFRLSSPAIEYHALSAPAAPGSANIVVVFRPQTTEAAFREALRSVDGRLVDGPTVADAYLVRVPANARAHALAALRAHGDVSLAEAVDADGSP
jgi:hypothetical protein